MLDEVLRQVRRLFSSKTNASKLVCQPIDRLHYLKQLIFGLSLLLLLGYGQFRKHFECRGGGGASDKYLSNFCYINGTTTVEATAGGNQSEQQQQQTHVGFQYRPTQDGRFEVINHNYVHSLWALLILMAICSYLAQRNWAALFHHRLLRALLRLPGHQEMELVRSAERAQPLKALAANKDAPICHKVSSGVIKQQQQLKSLAEVAGSENQHNHQLDYYPNQLVYLLLVQPASAYHLAQLRLRRRLLRHSLGSFTMTMGQFLLARTFIGPKFTHYGWHYLIALLHYQLQQIRRPTADVNAVDYHLSARIWPTSTQCEFVQFSFERPVSVVVQCTVAINEICGKLFAVIWWILLANLLVELHHLLHTLLAHLGGPKTTEWLLGRRSWPKRRREARKLATFRYRRALILGLQKQEKQNLRRDLEANNAESRLERKRREAEGSNDSLKTKSWYLWCPRDIFLSLARCLRNLWRCEPSRRNEERNCEKEEDVDIYHLLQLLHLRLGGSSRKLEQIIKITSEALDNYLMGLRQLNSSTTLTTAPSEATSQQPLANNQLTEEKANGVDVMM